MVLQIKRVYDAPSVIDGRRILVDCLWPRGIPRDQAKIDQWPKDIAPSHELRRWFDHDPQKWIEFQARYERELADPTRQAILRYIRDSAEKGRVTLLFAAKDCGRNNAVVLRRWLSPPKNGSKV